MSGKDNKKRGKWTETDMKQALGLVLETHMSQREAAKKFQVPRSTLRERLEALQRGETVHFTPQVGRFKKTFNDELEKQLVSYIKDLHDNFMPFKKFEFQRFVYKLAVHLNIPHQFKKHSESAGSQFYYTFMARYPDLLSKIMDMRSSQKSLGFNTYQVTNFFTRYQELLSKYNFSAYQVHNCDEIKVPIQSSIQEHSIQDKEQDCSVSSAEEGGNVTVLISINAAGDTFVPPMFVFPNKLHIDQVITENAPPGSIIEANNNGSMSGDSFKSWLELFVKRTHPTVENPVLLILNGNTYHKDCEVIVYAKEHNVHILSFPPQTTNKMQPLDQIKEPFQIAFKKACSDWIKNNNLLKISSKDIPSVFGLAYSIICRMDWVQSAFKLTGIWPFNPSVFSDADFGAQTDPLFLSSMETQEPVSTTTAPPNEKPEVTPMLPLQTAEVQGGVRNILII